VIEQFLWAPGIYTGQIFCPFCFICVTLDVIQINMEILQVLIFQLSERLDLNPRISIAKLKIKVENYCLCDIVYCTFSSE